MDCQVDMDIIDSIIRSFSIGVTFQRISLGIKFIYIQQEVFQITRALSVCCQSCNNSIYIGLVIVYKENGQPVVCQLQFLERIFQTIVRQSARLRVTFPFGQLD